MRVQDMIKLVSSGRFVIYRINECNDQSFILKMMSLYDYPSWKIIREASTYEDAMKSYIKEKFSDNKRYSLLCSREFTTFDLKEICNNKFRILRIGNDGEKYIVYEFCNRTISWNEMITFPSVYYANPFLLSVYDDENTIVVD